MPFFDSGYFKIIVFDEENNNLDNITDINEKLGINNRSIPPDGFSYPLINAIFLADSFLFVNLFDTETTTNWHFLYEIG